MSKFSILTLLMAVLISCGWAECSWAQIAQAEIHGAVSDASDALVPGVTVTATQLETGSIRTVVTTERGAYIMPALPVGPYTIRAELPGFITTVRENVRLAVGQSALINFTMKVASVEQTVTVAEEAPLVDSTKSEVSGRIDPAQIESLPLNGRNWLDLVALVPGARGTPGSIQAAASGSDMAKYQVDGVDISGQCCGGSNQGYSQENVQEFQVLANRFDAEYGRAGGMVINAVTKSGTNQFHGTGFGYFRNDKFGDAPNFFTNQVLPFDQKQVGVNGGGPFRKDKSFFFGSYEQQKLLATARPNTGFAIFDVNVPQDTPRYYTTGRIDQQVNNNHRLFLRMSEYNWNQPNQGVGGSTTVSAGNSQESINTDLSIGETWVMSSRAVNEMRAGFSRINNQLHSNSTGPRLSFPSAIIGSPTNSPQWWKEWNIQINDSLSYFAPAWHGQHELKMGIQFFRPRFWGAFPSGPPHGAQFNFAKDPSDFNDPRTYPQATSYSVVLGDPSYTIVNPVYAGFLQDNWTINRRLTLNLGLRYDLETGTKNSDFPNPLQQGTRPLNKTNFAPRLGFAYDLRGNGHTVIRGGAGRYFDKVLLNITSNERRLVLGQFLTALVINPDFNNPLGGKTFDDYKALHTPANFILLERNYQTPKNDEITIGIAQQIGSSYSVQADFVHTKGTHEPLSPQINYFEDPQTHLPRDPSVFGRPYPQYLNIQEYDTGGRSLYNGLQIGMGRRSTKYSFQGSYTLSKTYDNHNGNRFTTPNNPFNLNDEYAYSQSDQRHRFTLNGLARLPWGVQLSSIFFAGSRLPIGVGTSLDPFHLGYSGRWLDATGRTVPRNSQRTTKSDHKIDLRLSKVVKLERVSLEGVADIFNIFNMVNYNRSTYGSNVFAKNYLQPGNSTSLFYQPRQVQLGFRISF